MIERGCGVVEREPAVEMQVVRAIRQRRNA
jgi:hypothetical protein